MQNVGIELTKEQVAAIILKLNDLPRYRMWILCQTVCFNSTNILDNQHSKQLVIKDHLNILSGVQKQFFRYQVHDQTKNLLAFPKQISFVPRLLFHLLIFLIQ